MFHPAIAARQWFPVVVSAAALSLAMLYGLSRKTHATEGIQEMGNLGTTLSDTAQLVRDGTRSPEDRLRLAAEKSDLQKRMTDSLEPSLVQAELMKTAQQAGLVLREIQPVREQIAGANAPAGCPRYRILVNGSYPQIAEYMQLCGQQGLPARVTEFSVRPVAEPAGGLGAGLTADLTVEAFRPNDARRKDDRSKDRKGLESP